PSRATLFPYTTLFRSVPGVRNLLKQTEATVAAISPVVGGASLKGPTDRMLADLGMQVSAAQVARLYSDVVDVFILDVQDEPAKRSEEHTSELQSLTKL